MERVWRITCATGLLFILARAFEYDSVIGCFALPIRPLLFAEASAVPMIPLGPVDISGSIVRLQWIPAKRVKGIPGMSGSAGVDRTIHAHFLAALEPYAGPDAALVRLLNHMVGAANQNPTDPEQAPALLVVWINSNMPNQFKKGMRIRLPAYTIFGDEGGIRVAHDSPVILDAKLRPCPDPPFCHPRKPHISNRTPCCPCHNTF